MKKIAFYLKRFLIKLVFNKYDRMHIYQSLCEREERLDERKILDKYFDLYNYDDDIKSLNNIEKLFLSYEELKKSDFLFY